MDIHYSPEQRRSTAIRELVGEPCSYDSRGDVITKWRIPEGGQPSESDIDAEIIRQEAEWTTNQYQRDRQYPSIGDQLDMQFHDEIDGTTTWRDAVAKVKSDNPKPDGWKE